MKTTKHKEPMNQPTKTGFTLVEVLLTSVLSVALLAALWALFSIHLRLFETGHTNIEQSQLVRALMQQLSDDLHSTCQTMQNEKSLSAVVSTEHTNESNESPTSLIESTEKLTSQNNSLSTSRDDAVPVNPFSDIQFFQPAPQPGLIGTEYSLQMDVLSAIMPNHQQHESNLQETQTTNSPRVPELQTVTYSFQEPALADDPTSSKPAGLLRRQKPWGIEQASPLGSNSPMRKPLPLETLKGETPSADTDSAAGLPSAEEILEEEDEYLPASSSEMRAPEVVAMKFRYFDGFQWYSSWNSLQRNSLPVAVEVAMQVRTFDHLQKSPQENVTADSEDYIDPQKSQPPIYRLVINLSESTKRDEFSDTSPTDVDSEIYSPIEWPGFVRE